MACIVKNFLVVLLVVLQGFAPLVHAHASENQNIQKGLHLPGLEAYSHQQEPALLSAVTLLCNDIDGLIIGIDTGINKSKETDAMLSDIGHYLPSAWFSFNQTFLAFQINFSPQSLVFTQRLFFIAHAPRAPPTVINS